VIRWIFFDIGYTLVNEDAVWQRRCSEQAESAEARALGLTPQDIYHAIEDASRANLPQYRTVVRRYGFTSPAPYRHELETLYPNAEKLLEELSKRYQLGVIANQTGGLDARLEQFGIRQYFSAVVSSWEYQCMKPDPRLYEIALDLAQCAPEEAVMVGDRLDNDVAPAKSVGMHTIWIRQGFGALQSPQNALQSPDHTIDDLNDLLDIL